MAMQVVLIAGAALLTIRACPTWTTAIVAPVVLLNWGHCENWLMGYQINFAAFALFSTAIILRWHRNAAPAGTAWLLLLLAASSGGAGLLFGAPMAVVLAWRRPQFHSAIAGLALLAYWLAIASTYERPQGHPPFQLADSGRALQILLQTLSIGVAPGLPNAWPLIGSLMALMIGGTMFQQVRRQGWKAAVPWLGAGAVLVGIAIGRAGFDAEGMGLRPRYAWLAWPFVLLLLLNAGKPARRIVLLVVLLAFPANTNLGIFWGERNRAWLSDFVQQANQFLPLEQLALLHPTQEERAVVGIPMLRAAHWGEFRGSANPNPKP
jgi:hypothetical protein